MFVLLLKKNKQMSLVSLNLLFQFWERWALRAVCTNVDPESTSFRSSKLLIKSVQIKYNMTLKELKWDRCTYQISFPHHFANI